MIKIDVIYKNEKIILEYNFKTKKVFALYKNGLKDKVCLSDELLHVFAQRILQLESELINRPNKIVSNIPIQINISEEKIQEIKIDVFNKIKEEFNEKLR